jgi:hypothetical protein
MPGHSDFLSRTTHSPPTARARSILGNPSPEEIDPLGNCQGNSPESRGASSKEWTKDWLAKGFVIDCDLTGLAKSMAILFICYAVIRKWRVHPIASRLIMRKEAWWRMEGSVADHPNDMYSFSIGIRGTVYLHRELGLFLVKPKVAGGHAHHQTINE